MKEGGREEHEGWGASSGEASTLPRDKGRYNDWFYTHTYTESQIAEDNCLKNKGELHISWLGDRISTVSVRWLSFHSSPKTSLSLKGRGGGSGKELSIPKFPVAVSPAAEGSPRLLHPPAAAPLAGLLQPQHIPAKPEVTCSYLLGTQCCPVTMDQVPCLLPYSCHLLL